MEKTTSPALPSAALSRPMLALLFSSFLLNAASGVALWLGGQAFWRVLHGWSVPFFLISLGAVWRAHIVRGWRLRRHLASGLATLLVLLALTVTGWMLYSSGSAALQRAAKKIHLLLGLAAPALLLLHGLLGFLKRSKNSSERV